MSQAAEASSAQVAKLPPEERLEVVERILDSAGEPDATLDALWAREADDRLAAYSCGEIKAVPLPDVIAKYQVSSKRACASVCWSQRRLSLMTPSPGSQIRRLT